MGVTDSLYLLDPNTSTGWGCGANLWPDKDKQIYQLENHSQNHITTLQLINVVSENKRSSKTGGGTSVGLLPVTLGDWHGNFI